MKNNRIWLISILFLTAAMVLSVGTAYARYREEITGDQAFQVKPLEQLTFATQQWEQNDQGDYILTFTMAESEEDCRMYLAVSEGVTVPEGLTVTLTLPAEETTQILEDGTVATVVNDPVVLTAEVQQITEGSSLYSLFGSGYVFRFYDRVNDPETGEETLEELLLDFEKEVTYTLTVKGLSKATEQTSLLRLFVEYAQ